MEDAHSNSFKATYICRSGGLLEHFSFKCCFISYVAPFSFNHFVGTLEHPLRVSLRPGWKSCKKAQLTCYRSFVSCI
eukprot:Gb_29492 [translate_table: standard]